MTDTPSTPSQPRPGERLFRRLTVFNTVTILLGCGLLLLVAIIFRPYIPQAVGDFVKKQIFGSVAVERAQDWLPASLRVKPTLPTFQIYLPPATLRETELLAERLKVQGFMAGEDEIWFPARFSADGQIYNVDIRLRGVSSLHWSGPKKSWTVKFKKDQRFNGYRRIDIVVPGDRGYETEHVINSAARKVGLLTPDSGFVTVQTNGVDMGLYFWFEHLTAEMLERHGYPEGILMQRQHPAYVEPGFERMGVDFFERKDHLFEARHAKGAERGRVLGRWRRFMELIRSGGEDLWVQIPHYLDVEKLARWNAIISMLGHRHAMIPGNLKWFFNPTTGLFEPVMFDVSFPVQIDTWSEQGRRDGGPFGSFDARGFRNVIVD